MRQIFWIALAAIASLALFIGYVLGNKATLAPAAVGAEAGPRTSGSAHVAAGKSRSSRNASNSVAPLPPPGTPLKQAEAELQARADSGDAEAASRLYRDTLTCYEVRKVKTSSAEFAKWALEKKPDGATPEALQRADRILESIQKQLDYERDNAELCEGLGDAEINAVLPHALHAAQLGDPAAAECYLGARLTDMQGLLDHPEWLYDYKLNAPALIDTGLAQGNWGVVMQVAQALRPGPFGSASLLSQLIGHDPSQYYRYLKLISLGNAPGEPKHDEARLQLADAASALDANALLDADAWAQDTYQRHFQPMPQYTAENSPFRVCRPGMQVDFR
jgi:hypothetical protein